MKNNVLFTAGLTGLLMVTELPAAQWSNTEVHLQYGDLTNAFQRFGGEDEYSTTIITLQHASGWKYGNNFFFVDHITDEIGNQFYGEWYPSLSSSKTIGAKYGGIIRDVGLVLGMNAAPEVDLLKYLPGIQIDWDIPGFVFVSTLLTSYIDSSQGTDVPKEDDSFMIDVAWKYPIEVGGQSFSIEGHAEFIDGRDDENGGKLESWILAQPQFRWDAGKTLFGEAGMFHLGIEYQYWKNKLGQDENESAVQLLAVWGL